MFENDRQAAFFFGEPLKIFGRIWTWFVTNADIYRHLWVTLLETVLAFAHRHRCSASASACGSRCSPMAAAIARSVHQGAELMPRVILAPIFAVWFGLGIAQQGRARRDAGVLHRLLQRLPGRQGSEPGGARQRAHARRRRSRQLLRHVYLPSATSWVFSSLHTSVGLAFVGAVVGEYLGSSRGVGYLILQAEGTFDINTVMAGILVLTAFALAARRRGRPDRAAPDEVAAEGGRDREA